MTRPLIVASLAWVVMPVVAGAGVRPGEEAFSLQALRSVEVVVEPLLPQEDVPADLTVDAIRARIEVVLRRHGIAVHGGEDLDTEVSNRGACLHVNIDTLRIERSGGDANTVYAYAWDCKLHQVVSIQSVGSTTATTWDTGGVSSAPGTGLTPAILHAGEECAERFAADFLAANPRKPAK